MRARHKGRIRFRMGLAVILLIFFGICCWNYFTSPLQTNGTVTVVVPKNASTTGIANLLLEKGLIRSTFTFKLYARLNGFDGRMKAGTYRFSGQVSLNDIDEQLAEGRAVTETFTIPEGYTLEQMAELLSQKGLVQKDRFLDAAEKGKYAYAYLPAPGTDRRLEGFLFPDTYRIPEGYSEQKIIQTMLARFDQVFTKKWRERTKATGMSIREVVTLASIIEREAKVQKDRPLVSSVFHNRLAKGMQLESCATVQYALGEVKEVLLYEDLKIDSPYNTYRHQGLPPGPIAAPGAAALSAALYPADTDYLYFVAKKDGSHYFSKTLAEHNRAKKKYLH